MVPAVSATVAHLDACSIAVAADLGDGGLALLHANHAGLVDDGHTQEFREAADVLSVSIGLHDPVLALQLHKVGETGHHRDLGGQLVVTWAGK